MFNHMCDPAKSWALYDARGIYCCRVCDICEESKRAKYRPEIFTDYNYPATEPIDDEDWRLINYDY